MSTLLSKLQGVFIITAVYILTFCYMLPLRNQTYQDDWAYIQSVQDTIAASSLVISDWVAPSSVTTTVIAASLAKMFGFSIILTHITNILILYFGLIAFYFLLKSMSLNEERSIIFTLFLLTFPWVFPFSYSFITEVPYMSFLIISLTFYVYGFQKNSYRFIILGSIFTGLAYLIRQLALALPISLFFLLLYETYDLRHINIKKIIACFLPFLILYALYAKWLTIPNNMPNGQYQVRNIFPHEILPYLLPINLGQYGTTFGYYATFIRRVIFFFHHAIGFLLPIFLIFKPPKLKTVFLNIYKFKKGILIASLIYFFCLSIEIYYHFHLVKFTIEVPKLITRDFVSYAQYYDLYWKYAIYTSVPIWLIIFGSTGEKIFNTRVIKRKKPIVKFSFVLISLITLGFIYQFAIFRKMFISKIPTHIHTIFEHRFKIYYHAIFSHEGLSVFRTSWLVIFLPLFILTMSIFLSINYKLKRKISHPGSWLVTSTFVIHVAMMIILGYFHWAQYTISIIPFFIITLAISTKNLSLSKPGVIVALLMMVYISLPAAKNRYQDHGIRWQLLNELIDTGVQPINTYYPDESWLQYWYYKETFYELANERGTKYSIRPGEWATWRKITPTTPYLYETVKVDSPTQTNKQLEILYDTGPIHTGLFSTSRYLLTRSPKQQ